MRILLACILLCTCAWAQVHTPAKGSAERKSILDALRAPVQRELKQKVTFQVTALRVQGPWAFVSGAPRTPKGAKIDYKKTKYKEQLEAGMFDDGIFALLKKSGSGWKVLRYVIGPTDVTYITWPDEFHAPKAIFGQ